MTPPHATADDDFADGCRTGRTARRITVADAVCALAPLDLAALRRLPADELEQQLEARWALYRHLDSVSGGRHGPCRRDPGSQIGAVLLDLIGSLVVNVHEAEARLAVRRLQEPSTAQRPARPRGPGPAGRS
ncbi:hypothetical protein [Streptomyces sp. NPDC003374]